MFYGQFGGYMSKHMTHRVEVIYKNVNFSMEDHSKIAINNTHILEYLEILLWAVHTKGPNV